MSLTHNRSERTKTQSNNETFFDSLYNKVQLNITNKSIRRWTVRGEYLYFRDENKKIIVYSIAQSRVERELRHEHLVSDFSLVGDSFLVSVGLDFVRVWNVTDGVLLASMKYEQKYGYKTCIAVSATSVLYIAQNKIRRLDIVTQYSTAVQLKEVNMTTFTGNWIWPSEVCCGKIALVFESEKGLIIFDIKTFKVAAQFDFSPHLTEGFQLKSDSLRNHRNFDVSFPGRVVFCVGNSDHSKLKILILDPLNFNLQESFTVQNPILEQHPLNDSRLSICGEICIDAYTSNVRIQYRCKPYYYEIFDVSLDEKKLTSSYSFQTKNDILPNCKSLCNGFIGADEEGKLILRQGGNNSITSPNGMYGTIEQLYQNCIRSEERAVHFCEQLSPALFNRTLLELYCAHRLLMMAIQDGDVQQSLHHNGVQFKWHKAIYAETRNVKLESTEDENELTFILMEAVKFNVIESVGQFLLAHQIVTELREQDRKIFNMGRQLFVRLVHLETAHMNLEKSHGNLVTAHGNLAMAQSNLFAAHRNLVTSHQNLQKNQTNLVQAFNRYRKIQGMAGLMGVALGVIPFLGGSIAAVVTAGAEVAQGLEISDVVSGSLQISVDVIKNSSTFEQGVVRCVSNSLRRQEIKDKPELLKSLTTCGVTIDQLESILSTTVDGYVIEEDKPNEKPNESEMLRRLRRLMAESSTARSSSLTGCSSRESTSQRASSTKQGSSAKEVPDACGNSDLDFSNLEQWKPSEFKKLSMDRGKVSILSLIPCSFFVAALMVQFDDAFMEEFRELQPLVLGVNKCWMITGDVLCDYESNSEEIGGAIDELKEIDVVKAIMLRKLMKFIENK